MPTTKRPKKYKKQVYVLASDRTGCEIIRGTKREVEFAAKAFEAYGNDRIFIELAKSFKEPNYG